MTDLNIVQVFKPNIDINSDTWKEISNVNLDAIIRDNKVDIGYFMNKGLLTSQNGSNKNITEKIETGKWYKPKNIEKVLGTEYILSASQQNISYFFIKTNNSFNYKLDLSNSESEHIIFNENGAIIRITKLFGKDVVPSIGGNKALENLSNIMNSLGSENNKKYLLNIKLVVDTTGDIQKIDYVLMGHNFYFHKKNEIKECKEEKIMES
ncbi:Uncharacterised protein [Candidatus Tiddalikarchaeum anstoanum]|nr:Uncharacterised protein [Candidatus Tiddalikarchaeum anstoanum]